MRRKISSDLSAKLLEVRNINASVTMLSSVLAHSLLTSLPLDLTREVDQQIKLQVSIALSCGLLSVMVKTEEERDVTIAWCAFRRSDLLHLKHY
jgi:hypothetical protein